MIKIEVIIAKEETGYELYNGFWNIFFLHCDLFKKLYVKFKFVTSINVKNLKADIYIISSRFFKRKTDFIDLRSLQILEIIKSKNKKTIWFDMRDSAGTTQFEVLPYVDLYIKKQFYRDLKTYKKKLYGGRVYSDFYNQKFNIKDQNIYHMKKLDDGDEEKLLLGWNIGVRNFSSTMAPRRIKSMKYLSDILRTKLNLRSKKDIKFKSPDSYRFFDLVSNHGKNIRRNSVRFQRELFDKKFRDYFKGNVNVGDKVSIQRYYKTLMNSKVLISLYGWGEICYKEFEATICGCCFIMPDMSNIKTWPNIYQNEITYLPIKWDLSNLEDIYKKVIRNSDLRIKLVKNSQKEIQSVRNEIGYNYFLNIFERIIN